MVHDRDRLLVGVGLRVLGRMLAVGDRDRAEVATGAPDRCIQRLAIIATCAAGVDNPCGWENELSAPVESAFSTSRVCT